MEVVNATLRPLYPREMNPILVVGSWVDPKARVNERGKSSRYRDSNPGPSSS